MVVATEKDRFVLWEPINHRLHQAGLRDLLFKLCPSFRERFKFLLGSRLRQSELPQPNA